jgi:hypothetical protein
MQLSSNGSRMAAFQAAHAGSNPANCTTRPGGQIGKVACSRSRSCTGSSPVLDTKASSADIRNGKLASLRTRSLWVRLPLGAPVSKLHAFVEEWQTRSTQSREASRHCGFDSHQTHQRRFRLTAQDACLPCKGREFDSPNLHHDPRAPRG